MSESHLGAIEGRTLSRPVRAVVVQHLGVTAQRPFQGSAVQAYATESRSSGAWVIWRRESQQISLYNARRTIGRWLPTRAAARRRYDPRQDSQLMVISTPHFR